MPEGLPLDTLKELERLSVAASVSIHTPAGATHPFAVVPNGYEVKDLAHLVFNTHQPNPERKTGAVSVRTAASFIEYWGLFSDEDSQVFADPDNASVLAVLDYHHAESDLARWRQHSVTLVLQRSAEWKTWKEWNGKPMTQAEFAEFLEDNAPDITAPDSATFIEAARDLRAKSDVSFSSATSLANGSVQFQYNETTTGKFGKDQMDIPERFRITIPIFQGMGKVDIEARLRYRINSGGKLTMFYSLHRADYHERDAFEAVVNGIQEAIGKHVFIGKP